MPAPADDKWFGGKPGAARKAYEGIVKQYGLHKGEEVYFALLNKRKALARAKRRAR